LRIKWNRLNRGDTPSKPFQCDGEKVHSNRFTGLPDSSIGPNGTRRLPLISGLEKIICHPTTTATHGWFGCRSCQAGSNLSVVSAAPETLSLEQNTALEKTRLGITIRHQRNITVWYKPYRVIPFIVLILTMHSAVINEVPPNGE